MDSNAFSYVETLQKGGFDFSNVIRNTALVKNGIIPEPQAMKTGTTIVGAVFNVGGISNRLGWSLFGC
jgi:hypothetical protein